MASPATPTPTPHYTGDYATDAASVANDAYRVTAYAEYTFTEVVGGIAPDQRSSYATTSAANARTELAKKLEKLKKLFEDWRNKVPKGLVVKAKAFLQLLYDIILL
ncbi:hypothetical protein AGMMS49593_01740 [Endomicrobiia bacterium]|nr:hypothetical protein AGMMS49593_01740 [Endomicrobiia bacterium]